MWGVENNVGMGGSVQKSKWRAGGGDLEKAK